MLDFCNAQKNRSEFKFFLSIVFTVDTKIRKEFYLLVYFVIFGGGVRYFNVGMCLLCIYEVREIYCFGFRRGSRGLSEKVYKFLCPLLR